MNFRKCKICLQQSTNENSCRLCGYNAQTKQIMDAELFKTFYQKINYRSHHWHESIEFLLRSIELLKCSQSYLAKVLSISKAKVSDDLTLARKLIGNPELKKIQSKTKAKRHIDCPSTKLFETEENLQRYLYSNWNKTPFSEEWSLVPSTSYLGKFPAGNAWEIDFLAHHKKLNKWLVIEIKQDKSSDETIGQILRYIGWVKKNKARKTDEVEGLIICGSVDEEILSALICVPFVQAQIYRKEGDKIKFMSYEQSKGYDIKLYIKSLSTKEKQSIKEVIKKEL